MPRRLSFIAAIIACVPSIAFAINIPALPAGMCALDANVPAHAVVVDYLTNANKGSNTVLATFAHCDELAAIATKKGTSISHYGVVLSQSLGAQLPIDRKAYVETAAAIYGDGNSLTATALSGAQSAIGSNAAAAGLGKPKAVTASANGVIFKNDDMLIISLKQTNQFAGKPTEVASTAAMTLIAGNPVSVNLYAPATDANAFQNSGATLQPFITKLIAAN